ncbi:MAG: hypothetical protein GTN99_10895 [Candidatus Dadabacteria bacterium]|nr:hypothetical protein [Candidatus Dadabacteria bacterium]
MWIKIKRIIIVIGGVITALLGLGGIIGIIFFGKPEMKSIYWYLVLGFFELLAGLIGLYLIKIGLFGSDKQVSDVSL